jgi:glycosyltransferase involved in cell wall biosynthesis
LKIAFLTTDNREHHRRYDMTEPYFGTAPEALLQGFATIPEAEVHVVTCTQRPMKSPEKLADNIWFHSLPVPKIGWLRTGYQGCIRATRTVLRGLQPDIVHGQGTERDCSISAVFSGFCNVITIHGNMRLIATVNRARPFSFEWLAARLEAFTIPRSDGVVCITRYTQNAVQDLARKTWIVPNAVDQGFFEIKRAPLDEPTILCAGYIALRKNQNAFIRALDPLAERLAFKLAFLGHTSPADSYGAEFFDLIKTRPWCEYAGFANRNELKERLIIARLVALPSLEENCPMVVLEAMAAGVPIVAANVGGVPDLIEQNVNGILFNPTNAESMRTVVASVLENPEAAQAIAQTAKQRALERFHPRVIARQHMSVYAEVLNSSS